MVKIKIKTVDKFNKIIKFCSLLHEDNEATFDDKGISIRALNSSQTLLSKIFIDKKMFEEYKVDVPETISFNFEVFYKICNSMKKGFILESTPLEFTITSPDGKLKRGIKKFTMEKDIREDPAHSKNCVKVNFDEFSDCLGLSEEVDVAVQIIGEKDLIFKNRGNLETLEMVLEGKVISPFDILITTNLLAPITNLSDINKELDLYADNKFSSLYFEVNGENCNAKGWLALRAGDTNGTE